MRDVLTIQTAFTQGLSRIPNYKGTEYLSQAYNCVVDSGGLVPWKKPTDSQLIEAGLSECLLHKDNSDVYIAGDVSGEGRGLWRVSSDSPLTVEECSFLYPESLAEIIVNWADGDGWEVETASPKEYEMLWCNGSPADVYTMCSAGANRLLVFGFFAEVESGEFRVLVSDGVTHRYGPWIYSEGWHYFILDTMDMTNPSVLVDYVEGFVGGFGNSETDFVYLESSVANDTLPEGPVDLTSVFGKTCVGADTFVGLKYRSDLFLVDKKSPSTICGLRGRLFSTASYVGPTSLNNQMEDGWNFRYDEEHSAPVTTTTMVRWTSVGLQDFMHEMCSNPWFGRAVTGEDYLETMERNEHGFVPLTSSFDDELICLRAFDDWVAAYCTDSIYMLRPIVDPHSTVTVSKISDIGVLDKGHVAASRRGHLIVRSDDKLCIVNPDGSIEIVGDSHLILDGDLIGSYLSFDEALSLTDGDEYTLLFKENAFTMIGQAIFSSVQIAGKGFYTFRESAYDEDFVIRSGRLDMGSRRRKTILGVEVGFRGTLEPFSNLQVISYVGGEALPSVDGTVDSNGYCQISATGVEFELVLSGAYDNTQEYDFVLDWIRIEYSIDERGAGRPLA